MGVNLWPSHRLDSSLLPIALSGHATSVSTRWVECFFVCCAVDGLSRNCFLTTAYFVLNIRGSHLIFRISPHLSPRPPRKQPGFALWMIMEFGNPRIPRKREIRTRAPTACQTCRLRKTRCDNTRPTCSYCAVQGMECNYPETSPHQNQ